MRVKADGSAEPERLATGKFKKGRYTWAYWLRQPVLSPDGKTIAIVTDAPNPDKSNVVLQFFNPATKKIKRAGVPESRPPRPPGSGVAAGRQVPRST